MQYEFDSRIHYIRFGIGRLQYFFAVAFFINNRIKLVVYGLYY